MKLKRKLLSSESDAKSHDESFDKLGTPKEDLPSEAISTRERLDVKTSSSRKRKLKVIKFELGTREISFKKQKKYGEIKKHLHNIRTILLNSNATPIKCKQGIWYSCCFCKNKFSDPIELKIHTIETHDDSRKLDFMNDTILTKFIVKLDISGLQCNCSKSFENLNDLTDHLVKDHSKTYHTDINSQILPFRFESGLLKCIICEATFNSFKLFIEHMNLHFPNYVCGQCSRGFVTKERLQIHFSRHRNEGVFSCSFCTKVFNSKLRQKEHMRQVHITQNKRNKCGICGEKFTDYTHKYKHEEEVHGVKKTLLHCQACDKSYNNQRALTAHKKTFHLMEYPKTSKKKTVIAS